MQHAAFIIKSTNNSIDGEKKKENYCSVKKKQEEEGEREGGAPPSAPATVGGVWADVLASGGNQWPPGTSPLWRGRVGPGECVPQLKQCVHGLRVVVERSLVSAHGCSDVQDEDPGAARQLRRGEGRRRRRRRRGARQAELRGRSPAGPDSAYRGKQLGR